MNDGYAIGTVKVLITKSVVRSYERSNEDYSYYLTILFTTNFEY